MNKLTVHILRGPVVMKTKPAQREIPCAVVGLDTEWDADEHLLMPSVVEAFACTTSGASLLESPASAFTLKHAL